MLAHSHGECVAVAIDGEYAEALAEEQRTQFKEKSVRDAAQAEAAELQAKAVLLDLDAAREQRVVDNATLRASQPAVQHTVVLVDRVSAAPTGVRPEPSRSEVGR